MKISALSSLASLVYNDELVVYHYTKKTDGVFDDTAKSTTPDIQKEPCHLSFSVLESPAKTQDDGTEVKQVIKVFCANNVKLKAGDYVTVTRRDGRNKVIGTYSGTLGLPAIYATHQEALLEIKKNA